MIINDNHITSLYETLVIAFSDVSFIINIYPTYALKY